MFSRGFMYERPMLGHNMFEALPVNYDLGQAAPAPVVVTTPPPVVVTPSSPMATIGTVAVVGALGFFALELTGVTHVLGIKKYKR